MSESQIEMGELACALEEIHALGNVVKALGLAMSVEDGGAGGDDFKRGLRVVGEVIQERARKAAAASGLDDAAAATTSTSEHFGTVIKLGGEPSERNQR